MSARATYLTAAAVLAAALGPSPAEAQQSSASFNVTCQVVRSARIALPAPARAAPAEASAGAPRAAPEPVVFVDGAPPAFAFRDRAGGSALASASRGREHPRRGSPPRRW